MRMLLWSAVVLIVVMWLFRTKKISSDSKGSTGAGASDAGAASSRDDVEPMLPCAHCGTHIPASEAVISPTGAAFCSQEHRLKHGDA